MSSFSKGHLRLWVIGAGCGMIAAAGAVALSPALAGHARSVPDATGTCTNSTVCLQKTNLGTGVALAGVATANTGVVGQTTAFSARTGYEGVMGADLATPNPTGTPFNNAGVFGVTASGIGVWGKATNGAGVVGNSSGGAGVFGTTLSDVTGVSSAGVFGEDVGNSSLAQGVLGFSGTGIGVQADQFERGKFLNAAFLGLTFASSINTYFPAAPPGGLFNSDIGEGVVAESQSGSAEALAAANFGGGALFRAYQGHTEMLDLDNSGNMVIAGKLTQHGVPNAVTRTARGTDVVMYEPMQADATVEGVGEAQLRDGVAYVRIDPRFGATMSAASAYLVFVTPQGDTPGLFITGKTPEGFTVREHGGHSNIAFDYRIVARPFESQGARLAPAPSLRTGAFARSVTTGKPKVLPNGRIANGR